MLVEARRDFFLEQGYYQVMTMVLPRWIVAAAVVLFIIGANLEQKGHSYFPIFIIIALETVISNYSADDRRPKSKIIEKILAHAKMKPRAQDHSLLLVSVKVNLVAIIYNFPLFFLSPKIKSSPGEKFLSTDYFFIIIIIISQSEITISLFDSRVSEAECRNSS